MAVLAILTPQFTLAVYGGLLVRLAQSPVKMPEKKL